MTLQHSFTKIENELLPKFRRKIATAESTEDVKKNYAYTMQNLLSQALQGDINADSGDITLLPDSEPHFSLSEKIQGESNFSSTWNSSDLPHVISRFTGVALSRFKYLEKNPEKTKVKIRN